MQSQCGCLSDVTYVHAVAGCGCLGGVTYVHAVTECGCLGDVAYVCAKVTNFTRNLVHL